MAGLFKRINFFKGLFMQAEDWQHEQFFYREKQRFHNMYLHTPGVAFSSPGALQVTAAESGTAVSIASGYAIDGHGRDLFLPEPLLMKLPALQNFKLPGTIFITIRLLEESEDMRTNDANPEYTNHAYTIENTEIEITAEKPDNIEKLELARIQLSAKATYIKDAPAPRSPGPDEINLKHVPIAGAATATRRREMTLLDFADKVMDATIQVRTGIRKKDATKVFIEEVDAKEPKPMYMIHVQAMDSVARIQWWLQCHQGKEQSEYSLYIKNESLTSTSVVCRIFKMRL